MFQNIQKDVYEEEYVNQSTKQNILTNILKKQNILLYIISFMLSTISLGQAVSPFSLSIVAACFANSIPAFGVAICALIGNIVGIGGEGALNYILILLTICLSFFIIKPVYNEEYRNEKIKIGINLFLSILVVTLAKIFLTQFTIYDTLLSITLSIVAVVFYKIFVNSITVLQEYKIKKAFSIEEVIGASLLIAIAISALGEFSILGFSVRNVLSIFLVLVLGWQNGILIGTTAGVTIGVTLGIIAENEPVVVAAYAISGMIAGILNKFGKIGVILGFILGNGVLAYVSNGNTSELILFKEILIASIGLLAMPKNIRINIEEFTEKSKLLPVTPNRALNRSRDTIEKLNVVSEAIQDMADTYKGVAATIIEENDIIEKNKQIFISELLNNIDGLQTNMLYDDIRQVDGEIVNELFKILTEKQEISRKDFLETFAKCNSYIVAFDDLEISKYLENNIQEMIKAINDAYRISKVNFIWMQKVEENKKSISNQLDGVSKAISTIAYDIEQEFDAKESYKAEKEEIMSILKQKNFDVNEVIINKEQEGRYFINIYFESYDDEIENEDIEKIEKILTEVLNEEIVLNSFENNNVKDKYVLNFYSKDKYNLTLGIAKTTKSKSSVSGDSILQIKLQDGKYLVALSDGMGSGPEARKSSQIAIKMLGRLLKSGFDRDTSIDLINSTILNANEDIFATLDIAIFDLYKGNIEFIKNGACPTYIKNRKRVQLIKAMSLPAGLLQNVSLTVYDRDIDNNDILVMCSDGVLDSNIEYKNKELWLKYLLEDIEADNSQKIADLVLSEAIDNNVGIAKDDMSVIVCKITKY